jgi:glycosyltransferase
MFATGGGSSLFYPFVPLAWAFRVAGHEVRLVGKPQIGVSLMRTGLPVVTLGRPPDLSPELKAELVEAYYGETRSWGADWVLRPDSLTDWQLGLIEVLGRYNVAVSDAMADDLVAFAEEWRPDLIIHETLALASEIAGQRLDVPVLRYVHGTFDAFREEYRVTDNQPLPELVAMFERFGQTPPPGLPRYLDTVPPSMYLGAERPCIEMRYVPYNGPGTVPQGLRRHDRPRICFTWGVSLSSALGAAAADPYLDAITAIAAAGVEVLVLVTPDQLSTMDDLPPGVRPLAGVPLNLVLPYCDAIVHHGGDGTAMTAACLAVPQLVIPRERLADPIAGMLAKTGAAIHLPNEQLTDDPQAGRVITGAVDRLLTEEDYAVAAQRLREDIERQPSPAELVPRLAELAAGHGPLVDR